MYEKLTALIPLFQPENFEDWNAIGLDYYYGRGAFSAAVRCLVTELSHFVHGHPEYNLTRYADVLEEYGLQWNGEVMENADVENLDGRGVMALLVGAYRADHMCEGAICNFGENGCILKWLERLKAIDEA